ncbi:MAG: hypothetical protein EPN91_07700 [Salinibacterium sp.]|nr:MAG: hypothetical protein EPN91_07700 [Salinibacterium sp.]
MSKHTFPPQALVIRTIAIDRELGSGCGLVWVYQEITGVGRGKIERRLLFFEPLRAADFKKIPRMVKIEPLTVAAREAIDAARVAGKMSKINWRHWWLSNPEVRP